MSIHNEYVFVSSHFLSEGYLRGSDALRKAAKEAELEHPELINGTNLRKQVAILSLIVNLRYNELDVLAQYMGQDIQVHREFYCMQSATMQLAKISKLLLALDKGTLSQNCQFDDIEIGERDDLQKSAKHFVKLHRNLGDMRQDAVLLATSKNDLINALVRTCLQIKGNEKLHFNCAKGNKA